MESSRWARLRSEVQLPAVPDELLEQAFRHGSYVREQGLEPLASNQRLEFLGDAVLDLVIATELFRLYPGLPEGELTRRKSSLVRAEALARYAAAMRLGDHLLLGRGEEESGGRTKTSLTAEAFEALIGAVYLAGGLEAARLLILDRIPLGRDSNALEHFDNKSRLQELLQSHLRLPPRYVTVSTTGPAHAATFRVEVFFGETPLGGGSGRSKREAEQAAAGEALQRVHEWLPTLLDSDAE